MDLRNVEVFVSVAKDLNLRQTAKKIGRSQPAISLQLQALESELGFALLVRDRQRIVALTPAGCVYLKAAKSMVSNLSLARRAAVLLAQGADAVLKVGIAEEVASASRFWTAFRDCKARHPSIEVQFVELPPLELAPAVLAGMLDVAFTPTRLSLPGLRVTELWTHGWVVLLPEGDPLAQRLLLTAKDLANSPLILGDAARASAGHFLIEEAFARAGVVPQVRVRAMRRSTMITLVAAGLGITFMPSSMMLMNLPGIKGIPFEAEQMDICAVSRMRFGSALLERFWLDLKSETSLYLKERVL
ncbi:LysR family transcriptional regulator [Variovorax sp. GB1R11]|uniref:LysR family transcriptional regulator n=1 Tax=Variovorax sp. GB1R11 TaxID=3443741 RepID=UPI003F4785A1